MHGAFSGVPNVRGVASAMNEPSTSEKTVRTHQGARLSLTGPHSHHHHQPEKRLFAHIGGSGRSGEKCVRTNEVHTKEGLVHTKEGLVHTKERLVHTKEGLVHTTPDQGAR